jgi:hypothetical protein
MAAWQTIIFYICSFYLVPRLTFLDPSLRTLLTLFGPFLFPKLGAFIQSLRSSSRNPRVPIRPVPKKVQTALHLLFASATIALLATLPALAPENIFLKTQSRLQIPTDVLFARLALLRPLTPLDNVLKARFASADARLLYLLFGPDALAHCPFCGPDDPLSYLAYALPRLLAPHLLHLAVLGAATSSALCGPEGRRWRTHAALAGAALLVAEVAYLARYDVRRNRHAAVVAALDFAFWRVRVLRCVAVAATDAALGLALWLTASNRWLAARPSVAERVEESARAVEDALHRLQALGVLRNALVRDKGLRGVVEEYWCTEGEVMGEVVQEREVMECVNLAVERMDMSAVEGRVWGIADGIMLGLDGMQKPS